MIIIAQYSLPVDKSETKIRQTKCVSCRVGFSSAPLAVDTLLFYYDSFVVLTKQEEGVMIVDWSVSVIRSLWLSGFVWV